MHRTLSALLLLFTPTAAAQDEPWEAMDYGPTIATAVGIGGDMIVPKGLVVPLDDFDGEPSGLTALFDTETCQWRCVWRGDLQLEGIVYNGPHGTYPMVEGEVGWRVPALPGAFPLELEEACRSDPRAEPFGPLDPALVRFAGVHLVGDDVVLELVADGGRTRILNRVFGVDHEGRMSLHHQVDVRSQGEGRPVGVRVCSFDEQDGRPLVSLATDGGGPRAEGATSVRLAPEGAQVYQLAEAGYDGPRIQDQQLPDLARFVTGATRHWDRTVTLAGVVGVTPDEQGRRLRTFPAQTSPRTVRLASSSEEDLVLIAPFRDASQQLTRFANDTAAGRVLWIQGDTAFETDDWAGQAPDDRVGLWRGDLGSGAFERNAFDGSDDLRLDGVTWRRGVKDRCLDFDGTAAAWPEGCELDLGAHDLTVGAWIHTTKDGTVFALAPARGAWVRGGATLFVRDGRLSFDVGWVGVVDGGPRIDDGSWHHVAATYAHEGGRVRLFVDGEAVASGNLEVEADDEQDFRPRFGWTSEDFPADSYFSGYMDALVLLRDVLEPEEIQAMAATTGEPLVTGTVLRWDTPEVVPFTVETVSTDEGSRVELRLPPLADELSMERVQRRGLRSDVQRWARAAGGGALDARPFRIDRLSWPQDNPWDAWMRFGAFDFEDATTALITTWSGDVWRVSGIDADLDELAWQRVASGLNQPFGLEVTDEGVFVLGRDQITRLHDGDGDGEADRLENWSNLVHNSEHFHEPASGLIVAPDGHRWLIKAARHAKHALHAHHGTILRLSPDGTRAEVAARGFRAPIGLTMLPDGSLLCSDQEGHWTPANRINLVRPDVEAPGFYGNGWCAQPGDFERVRRGGEQVHPASDLDEPYTPPLCWLHPGVDRSPSSQVWVDHEAWGPLNQHILGLSYGTGEVYLVLRDDVPSGDGQVLTQGGVVKLGIQLPTGLLHGRVHPETGDLYVCGLFGWSSDRTQEGGFYRVVPDADAWAATLNVPHAMRATTEGLELTFLHPLDATSAARPEAFRVSAWNYQRTPNYGSPTVSLDGRRDERTTLRVTGVELDQGGTRARLAIEGFQPAMQVQVEWDLLDATGRSLEHEAHLTVHALHAD